MREEIVLVGGGGHCRSCVDVIELQDKFSIAGIIDLPSNKEKFVLGYSVIGNDEDLEVIAKKYNHFLVTVGQIRTVDTRVRLFKILQELKITLPTIISPLAYVSKHAKIDEGSIIMHHAFVNTNVKIGKNCIINSKALIEHDSVIGDHCHISTGAIINGGSRIGGLTFFGSGAVCRENTEIKEGSFIRANSIVK